MTEHEETTRDLVCAASRYWADLARKVCERERKLFPHFQDFDTTVDEGMLSAAVGRLAATIGPKGVIDILKPLTADLMKASNNN